MVRHRVSDARLVRTALRLPLLAALSLWNGFAYGAAEEKPDPIKVEQQVKAKSAREVVGSYYANPESWSEIEKGIASGGVGWLKAYKLLRSGTDAGSSESLDEGLSKALLVSAKNVLALMSSGAASAKNVCGRLDDSGDEAAHTFFLERQRTAVERIKEPGLAASKVDCLKQIANVKRHH